MLVVYLYQEAFTFLRMGYAATLAWVLLIMVLVLTAVNFWLGKRWGALRTMKAGRSPVPEPSVASGVSLRRLDLRRTAAQSVVYLFVLATVLFFLLPVFWMASTSFKEPKQVFSTPPTWIPLPPVADYYAENLGNALMRGYFKNTMIITGCNILAAVLVNPLVAFSFARMRWPGRRIFFTILLITIMLPVQVTLIPIYIIFRDLGWLNTYLPLIIPLFFGNPVYIFLLRQFILSMPGEMLDAGRIDGCNNYRLYLSLTLPLLGCPDSHRGDLPVHVLVERLPVSPRVHQFGRT